MSNRVFSDGIPRCRRRRTWGRTLVNLLVLIALVALSCWLWACVHGATIPMLRTSIPGAATMPLAMAPITQGMVMGALMSLTAVGIAMAVRKMRQHDLEAAKWMWVKGGPLDDAPGFKVRDVSMQDMGLIVLAASKALQEPQQLVVCAQGNLSVDDYGDALRCAERQIAEVRHTLRLAGMILGIQGDPFQVEIVEQNNLSEHLREASIKLQAIVLGMQAKEGTQPKQRCIYCPNCGVLAGMGGGLP